MESKIGAILDKSIKQSTCKHHWIIEAPEKATSRGVCKLCGEVKMFDNIIEGLVPTKDNKDALNLEDIVDTDEAS